MEVVTVRPDTPLVETGKLLGKLFRRNVRSELQA